MGKAKRIEERTKRFVALHKKLSEDNKMVTHETLANILGYKGKQSISEILGFRQNIDIEQWETFKNHFGIKDDLEQKEFSVHNTDKSTEKEIVDYKEKYYKLIEKENKAKDKTIEKLSLAVDKIIVVDDKVERLKITAG